MEEFETVLPAAEFAARFCDAEKSVRLCEKCPNYGTRWACPPFDEKFDIDAFSEVRIIVRRIKISGGFDETYKRARLDFDACILRRESQSAAGTLGMFAGSCANCPLEECTRKIGRKCIRADGLRTSLEAVGFDVSKIARELFGLEIEWDGANGRAAENLTLVSALFYP